MGIVKRQSVPSALVTYVGIVLGFVNFAWLLPNYSASEQVGLIRVLIAIAAIFSQFGTLGIGYTTLRYFPYYKNQEKKHYGFFTFLLLVGLIGFVIFSILLLVLQSPIKSYYHTNAQLFDNYFIYLFPLGGCLLFLEILQGYARSLFKTFVPTFIREVLLRVCNLMAIVLFIFKIINFHWLVILIIGGYAAQLLAILIYLRWRKQLFLTKRIQFLSKRTIKEMAVYSSYMFLTVASSIFILNIDVTMLGAMAGLSKTGIYSVVGMIATIIIIPSRTITQIVVPILAEAWQKNDLNKIKEMYRQTAINNFLIGAIIFILIWINIDSFFSYLPKEYAEGKWVFFVIGLARVLDLATGNNAEIIITSKHFRFILFSNIFQIIVSLFSFWWFIAHYGMVGAAYATAISILSYNFLRSVYIFFKYKIHPFDFKYLKGFFIILALILIGEYIPSIAIREIDIFFRSAIISILFIGMLLVFKPSIEIDHSIKLFLNRFFKLDLK